jgi:hypothetical protein
MSTAYSAERPAKTNKDLSHLVTIFDFDVVGKVDKDIARQLSDSMRHEIVNSDMFKAMNRANMDRILKEHAFQMTGGVRRMGLLRRDSILVSARSWSVR